MSRSRRRPSSLSTRSVVISVIVTPGATALIRMPVGPNSRASARVRPMRPGLRGAVGGGLGDAHLAEPRGDVDDRAAALLDHRRQRRAAGVERGREVGRRSRRPTRPASISRNGPTCVRPALFTRPSMRPKRSMTAATSRSAPGAVADVGREALARRAPASRTRVATVRSAPSGAGGSGPRRARPRRAALTATSAPIPRLLPVTRTTRPASASPIRRPRLRGGARRRLAQDDRRRQADRARRLVAREHRVGVLRTPAGPSSRSGSRTVESPGAVSAAVEMSSKPATDTCAGTSMPSAASRCSAPDREQVVRAADRGERHADPASSVSTPSAPPVASNVGPDDEPLVVARSPPRRGPRR